MIQINDYCHININFKNKVRVSITYYPGMKGSNYNITYGDIAASPSGYADFMEKLQKKGAQTAEVAVLYKEDFVVTPFSEDVTIPYTSAEQIIVICYWAMNASEEEMKGLIKE